MTDLPPDPLPHEEPDWEVEADMVEEGAPVFADDAAAVGGDAEAEAGPGDPAEGLKTELAERTADLQRLQAEFLNYKRRVDRDRDLVRDTATYSALVPVLDVLDTIDRAREHGPLEDGLKAVADQLAAAVASRGLTRFGEAGDAFDPQLHEALSHIGTDPGVEVTTVKIVAKGGYRMGDRVVRAAQVLVVDPADG